MIDRQSIVLRPANPTIEEGLAFARYVDGVSEGFFTFMIGGRAHQIMAAAFTKPGHDLSYENVTFAECEKEIVGMTLAYSAEQHRRSLRRPLKQAAGRLLSTRIRTVEILFAPVMRIIDSIADGDFYLQTIAVNEEFRSGGIGAILMDAYEQKARASGATRLALDVADKNEGARRLYERRGWTIESQWPKRLPIPAMRFYRMTKRL